MRQGAIANAEIHYMRPTYVRNTTKKSHLARLSRLDHTLCNESFRALGVEFGRIRLYVREAHIQHLFSYEVLHGVLDPEAHNNGSQNLPLS